MFAFSRGAKGCGIFSEFTGLGDSFCFFEFPARAAFDCVSDKLRRLLWCSKKVYKGKSHAHFTEFTFFRQTLFSVFQLLFFSLCGLDLSLLIFGPLKIKKIIETDKRFKKRMLLTRFELVLLDSKSRVLTTTL